jgi:CubicO group peptidase (beta-lactamase class C family)
MRPPSRAASGLLLLLAFVACAPSAGATGVPYDPQSATPATGPWLRVHPSGRALELLDGAVVEIRGEGRLTFRDGRRTIVPGEGLRPLTDDHAEVAAGLFDGPAIRLVDDEGETAWVLRRVDSLPDEAGTRIRDEDGGKASIATRKPTRFFLRAGPGAVTEFFHPATADGAGDPAVRRVREVLERFAGYGFSGVVTWSDSDRGTPITSAAGRRAGRGSAPMDAATIVELGSLTKQFTAAAVLELEDRGALSVDDPLRRWHPELPPPVAAITVHQLLLHTSGLPESADVPADEPEAVWRTLAGVELDAPPGADWSYSNLGYVVLAALAEETTPTGYRGLVAELVRRSQVEDIGFPGERQDWTRRFAMGGSGPLGTGRITERRRIEPVGWDGELGATGAVATMPALHDWFRALWGGRVLSSSATGRMFEEHPPEIAYGWFYLRGDDGSVRIAHGGDTRGFQTWLSWEPAHDRIIAVGVNDRRGWRAPVLDALDAILLRDTLPDLPPPVVASPELTVASPALAAAGRYTLADGSTVVVDTAGDRLRLAASGAEAIAMISGAGPALADSLREASRHADTLLAHLLRADTAALEGMLAPSGRPESFWGIWSHLTAEHAEPPVDGTVLGTIPDRAGRLVSFVRVSFSAGEETLRLVWRPHLDGWGTGGDLPTRDFWPSGDGRFVSFDPTRPGWVELRLEREDGCTTLRDGSGRRADHAQHCPTIADG